MEYNLFSKTKYLKKLLLAFFTLLGGTHVTMAYTGACTANNGTYSYNYNFGFLTVIDPAGNKPGYLFPRPYAWNLGGNYSMSCDCDPAVENQIWAKDHYVPDAYFKTETNLPLGHSDGVHQFYIINDYLETTEEVWVAGNKLAYVAVPWVDVSNETSKGGSFSYSCKDPNDPKRTNAGWTTGSKGSLWLYIKKPFVGSIFVENIKVLDIFASVTPGSYNSSPVSSIYVQGQVTVPQNCEINAGQIITVDFGKIWSGDFTTKGQKPDGYVAKNIKASMKCNNINAYTNLTIRFQSEISSDYPDAIKTNNPDIGVEIIDDNGHLVLPNTGLIPFHIDDKYEASVTFKAQPVSTTGNPPSAGQFQAQAYIRVDFA
ncbi:fimbrial protein [Hafnia alvei]|uniref:fimbrial protein n=1 Tax=Hafnia alvei TaxID=569 RepID=UPI000E07C63A|nr:fimbrial protein [Hafnia alvei]STR05098.1 long polar fimbrial protein LpfD [Hafnia alvei]